MKTKRSKGGQEDVAATANVEQRRGQSGSRDSGFGSWGPGDTRGEESGKESMQSCRGVHPGEVNNAAAIDDDNVLFSVRLT